MNKLNMAVIKLTSCSGCLNELIYVLSLQPELLRRINVTYFTELQDFNVVEDVDVAIIEGSVANREQEDLVKLVRKKSKILVALGTCAAYGGVQSLAVDKEPKSTQSPAILNSCNTKSRSGVKSIDGVVNVEYKLPGCPINGEAFAKFLVKLTLGGGESPVVESLCSECIRIGIVCVMVYEGKPCLGPITLAGCGALCPSFRRGCYGCYGLNYLLVDKGRLEEFAKVMESLGISRDDLLALLKAFSYTSISKVLQH